MRIKDVSVKASPDYHINEMDVFSTECKMIQSLNDLQKFREKDNYTLIYDGNDLTQLFYESKMAGYEPQLRFTVVLYPVCISNFTLRRRALDTGLKPKI